ncbi:MULTISPECIES: DNA replication/repair protein RecF [unclassified Enterococcus]|uniref:DNA replication/repair protein RecF n=1 Tax=unclassified Enterococcus TaxID=2608891 RepID=UPI001552C563|nr:MULTISPECIES: DNA replication/repair protein RecF [unclassified Enterococcus]MBS7576797.1 DNA replication/repair protein RecF [Enterococcus sp. MMGLQ5-2]MBS7584204.1 DNA replication/repair protein RecF [Enterococcus sp. MMGLQ5-1]NPD12060.1 DNA replication/repair protein RecF [Enterococcus sp. MMGLQ5-1]NPD36632.1 DNA replication/repair protein RecF [Enterococcus sp. MMGLQ5-2]
MKLLNIFLKNFRNYQELKLEFNPNLNIFIGENAQGKTNLLESIYFLALTRSPRTTSEKELIRWQEASTFVSGLLSRDIGKMDLEIQLSSKGRKTKINHLEQKKLSDYIGKMNVVLFSPEDLELVKGSPAKRRRFIDIELGQINPIYLYDLSQYNRILKQRNSYLKSEKIDDIYLSVLDEQLVAFGSKVIEARGRFILELEKNAQTLHQEISHGREELKLEYQTQLPLNSDIQSIYLEKLKHDRQRESFQKTTLTGPHRDELIFIVNDNPVSIYGSQGQQRTTALSVKLAEIELMKQEVGEYPILLLDDVMSELDNQRQIDLLESVLGKTQTFVSTTTLDHLQILPEALTIYQVDNGKLSITKPE